jgi:acetoin utilization protein AcuB
MSDPSVERFMTRSPHTVGQEQSLQTAHELMRRYDVRHLPVLHGGKLVGMLSQRDLHFIETLADVNPDEVTVSEAMSTDTYVVGPRASMRRVAEEMANQRYGSVVVMVKDEVVGILTTVDAMRALSQILFERRSSSL